MSLHVNKINNLSLRSTEVDGLLKKPGAEHVILASTLALIMIFAIFGNIALITTIHRKPSLHTLTNRFILNLACADVGVGLFCIPFSVVTCYTGEWIFGNIMCQLNGFMNILFSLTSVFTLTAISVEKYFSIVKPMVVVITTKVGWIMIAMTWMAALCFAVIPLTGFTAFDFKTGSTQCGVQVPSTLGQTMYAFLVFAAAFLLPLGIMAFCYMNIFRTARNHDKRLHRMSRIDNNREVPLSSQNQIAATIFILLIVFILCWTPYFVYMVYMTAHTVKNPDKHLQNLGLASYSCIFLNSCLNPLVYGVRNPLIRPELSWLCCPRCFNAQRQNRVQRTCAKKRQLNNVTTNAVLCTDNTSPVYPAYVNVVALTEEIIIGSNQDTVDRLQVKLSNCSSDAGYFSQEESGRACSGGGASD